MAAKTQRFLQNYITGNRGLHPMHIKENIAREKYLHARRRRLQRAQMKSMAGTARNVASPAKNMAGTARVAKSTAGTAWNVASPAKNMASNARNTSPHSNMTSAISAASKRYNRYQRGLNAKNRKIW